VDVVFQAATCSFITAAGSTIKIWDSRNGTLIKRHSDLQLSESPFDNGNNSSQNDFPAADKSVAKEEITALCLDWTDRRLLVGTLSGKISMWMVSSFAKLYQMDGHSAEVSSIKTYNAQQLIISTSWDKTVKVQILEDNKTPLTIVTLSHVSSFRRMIELAKASAAEEGDEPNLSPSSERGRTDNKMSRKQSSSLRRSSNSSNSPSRRRGSIVDILKNDLTGMRGAGRRQSNAFHSPMNMNQRQFYSQKSSAMSSGDKNGRRATLGGGMLRKSMELGLTFMEEQENWEVKQLAVSASMDMIATVSTNPAILVWDIQTPKSTRALGTCVGHQYEISAIEFMTGYPVLISSDMGGEVMFWSLHGGTIKPHRRIYSFLNPGRKIYGSTAAVTGLGWVPEDKLLVTADAEGRLKLWDVQEVRWKRGELLREAPPPANSALCARRRSRHGE
jgi:WD40 repeat protein